MANKKKTTSSKSSSKKKTASGRLKPTAAARQPVRKLKQSRYQTLRLSKRIKPRRASLPGAMSLLKQSFQPLKNHWKLFLTIAAIYGFLNMILVRGVGGGLNLTDIKESLELGADGQISSLATGATLFSYLLATAGSSATEAGGVYQSLLLILVSLVVIWALRQVLAGNKIRARDAFYKGTYPLIPFILVLLVVGLQLIPLLIGSWLYTTVIGSGIAVTLVEKTAWATLFFLLALLSLYMICSSLFALYIATLPDMTPMKALRSARALALHRRWTVLRKVLFLPLILFILTALIMMPFLLFLTPLAEWVFFGLSMLLPLVVHSYMYTLYRELL